MWPFGTNKVKSLEKKYRRMLEEATNIQRSGDLKAYASKIKEIDDLEKEMEALKKA